MYVKVYNLATKLYHCTDIENKIEIQIPLQK